MNSLFPNEPAFPDGFTYLPDFITREEEERLCEVIASLPLTEFMFHGFHAKRRVVSYGYDYHPDSRTISKGEPIPAINEQNRLCDWPELHSRPVKRAW